MGSTPRPDRLILPSPGGPWSPCRFADRRRALAIGGLLGLLLVAGPTLAQPERTLDLAAVTTSDGGLLRLAGYTGTGSTGVPVAGGFDCDGDGATDLAMSSMQASPLGRERAGEVYLVFGDGRAGGLLDAAVPQARILRIAGDTVSETAGSEIWMDDVTGDGLGDLLVARQNHAPDPTRPGAGALTIVVGDPALREFAATLQPLDLRDPPPSLTLVTLVGAAAVDRLGMWMRTGDVTGDGIADIVVGADQEDGSGENDRGAVYLLRGGPHLATSRTVDLAEFGSTPLRRHLARITPPPGSNEYHFGATCQIADLDGNGRGEVLVAAALNRAGGVIGAEGAPAGTAHGVGGSTDGTLYIAWDDNFPSGPWRWGFSFDIANSPGSHTIVDGGDLNRSFGEEILGGLDYDQDGLADLFVGDLVADGTGGSRPASGMGHVLYAAAQLRGLVFDLDAPPPALATTTFLGGGSFHISADTAVHGDFDADGISDLSFSSPHADPLGRDDAGIVHVFFGRQGRWPALIDLAPEALPPPSEVRIAEVYGARGSAPNDHGDTLCYSAAAGDVDGDARTDLITNEMVGNGLAPDAVDVGNMIVLSGALLSGLPACGDGLDNDADGLADFPDDPGCDAADDASERSSALPCDDGVDDDGDGLTDYRVDEDGDGIADVPGDPGCRTPDWIENPACQDGVDNDGRPGTDFDGGESIFGACSAGVCPPGVDDADGDGVADPDPQCVGKPWRRIESSSRCGLGFELAGILPLLGWLRMRRPRRA